MRFTPNQTLLDGDRRYEADVEYDDVPEDRAAYFVSLGWGDAPDLPADSSDEAGPWSEPATVTLAPDGAGSAASSEVG